MSERRIEIAGDDPPRLVSFGIADRLDARIRLQPGEDAVKPVPPLLTVHPHVGGQAEFHDAITSALQGRYGQHAAEMR